MSKVLTFSTQFPSYHPKKGDYTYFVEKFLKSKKIEYNYCVHEHSLHSFWSLNRGKEELVDDFIKFKFSDPFDFEPKNHTIRAGKRFKEGDYFSPRIWSGRPYFSKTITIAPDTEIFYAPKIEIYKTSEIIIDGKFYATFGTEKSRELAKNDGLFEEDLKNWFKYPKNDLLDFQIICWNKDLKY